MQWIYCLLFLLCFMLIIALCEWLHNKGLHAEYTRKTAHILSIFLCLFLPACFTSHWYVLLLVVLATLTLYIGRRKQLFKSIESVERRTSGSYLLPISIGMVYYLSLVLHAQVFFTLPLVVLAVSDSLSCIFGKHYQSKSLKPGKTLIGTTVFFISTFIICWSILFFQMPTVKMAGAALGISIITTGVEFVSLRGSDNLTIPLSVIGSLLLLDRII